MTNHYNTTYLDFRKLSIADKNAVQQITLTSGLQNCNYTFANLVGWQFWFNTEVCIAEDTVVFRFKVDEMHAYMINSSRMPCRKLMDMLLADAGGKLVLMAVPDAVAEHLSDMFGKHIEVESRRNNFDYIYLREELEDMRGKNLKNKRNHVNKFISVYPDYNYVPLSPELFDECWRVEKLWRETSEHDNPAYGDTVEAEQRVIERMFSHWDELEMIGGTIFVDGRMVAFSFGAPVTNDTFDVCVEKADRNIDGAFNIINQQFVKHLPHQYVYINREEDMGLDGLRKAKLSYHPYKLLDYNVVKICV